MKIDLANIAGTPGARGRFLISEQLAPTEGYSCVGPVTGELAVENTGSLLLVRGELRAVLRMACVRCLTEGDQSIEVEVEEEFASEDTDPDVGTVDQEEPETAAISDYVLDATEFVRQQVGLQVPMAFVCRPDCRGICPSCGSNLNEGPCSCPGESGDERWAELGELLEGERRGS